MNCKPGDLAITVKPIQMGFGGRMHTTVKPGAIVRVVRFGPPLPGSLVPSSQNMFWELEKPIRVEVEGKAFSVVGIVDVALRPLRDAPGDDESLTWTGTVKDKLSREFARNLASINESMKELQETQRRLSERKAP